LRSLWRGLVVAGAVSALIIVASVYFRSRRESKPAPPAVAVMNDFGSRFLLSSPGRFDPDQRSLMLGEGPDTIALKAYGRQPALRDGLIAFAATSAPAGRVELDADVGGDGLVAKATVDTQPSETSVFEPVLALLRGPKPETRSALLLVGGRDRYVALIISGNGSDPVLDWSLGPNKRGRMSAPVPTGTKHVELTLRIEPVAGSLEAIIGGDQDARVLGDPLSLGPDWREFFDPFPRMGLGCMEGSCVFHDVSLKGELRPMPRVVESPAVRGPPSPPSGVNPVMAIKPVRRSSKSNKWLNSNHK
jgi:hypothetical protein